MGKGVRNTIVVVFRKMRVIEKKVIKCTKTTDYVDNELYGNLITLLVNV